MQRIKFFYEDCNADGMARLEKSFERFVNSPDLCAKVISIMQSIEANSSFSGSQKIDGFMEPASGSTDTYIVLTVYYEAP